MKFGLIDSPTLVSFHTTPLPTSSQFSSTLLVHPDATSIATFFPSINALFVKHNTYTHFAAILPHELFQKDQESFIENLTSLTSTVIFLVPLVSDPSFVLSLIRLNLSTIGLGAYIDDSALLLSSPAFSAYNQLNLRCLIFSRLCFSGNDLREDWSMVKSISSSAVFVHDENVMPGLRSLFSRKSSMEDVFLDPLQPQARDLDLEVYKTFQNDLTKYAQYRKAVHHAIGSLSGPLNVLVVGPGLGPLISIVFELSKARITAVEKNIKVMDELRLRNKSEWNNSVDIIFADVRNMLTSFYESFDIVVSELLGSFACNELSPEILNSFTRNNTIMIPKSYTSYIQPIYASLIDRLPELRPHLCRLSDFFECDVPSSVFTFSHPGINSLKQSKEIPYKNKFPVNGLQGYFEAVLYDDIKIGNAPFTPSSEYCESWFPMVFPMRTKDSDTFRIDRKYDSHGVWYAWTFSDTYNEQGSVYKISYE